MTYMKGDNNMPTVLPKENEVEQFFSRIMASEGACERLSSVLYDHLSDDDMQTDPDPKHLVQVLLTAYTNGDISALLLELCGRSLFDLLREAYLIPKRFHGKAGKNPELLTTPEGDVIEEKKKLVTKHEFEKFRDVYKNHSCASRSKLYLADGYDLMRVYTDGMNIKEKRVDKRRGVLILYALPDTVKLGLSEAQTYNVIWNTFHKIQQTAPTAMVYYGQETGEKAGKSFDEIGVLLPVHQFEKKMLIHLSEIDGIVLACREEMMKKAGSDSLDL